MWVTYDFTMSLKSGQRHFLFIVNNYPPKSGGVEQHVQNLASSLVEAGQKCTVIALSKNTSDSVESGIRVIRIQQGFGFGEVISFPNREAAKQIRKMFLELQPTIISTHTRFFPMTWIGIFMGGKLGIPVIHTEHGSGFVKGVGIFVGAMSRIVDLTLGRYSLRRARKVLAVSENVANFVSKLAGVTASIFYNAVNLPTQQLPEQEPQDSSIPHFVFVGRLVPGKGADTFLRAAALLKDDGMNLNLELLGDGSEKQRLEKLAFDLGLAGVVSFRGKVAHSEVMSALSKSIYVNPTELSEGFQTTLLEAVVAGAQIVTYEAPGVEKLVSQRAPIRVVNSATVDSLTQVMKMAVLNPLPPMDEGQLEFWSWSFRAHQYLELTELTT